MTTISAKGDLKTIEYRGGVISFALPSDWVEQYKADGGATFYKDIEGSGILQLNVITAKPRSDLDGTVASTLTTLPRVIGDCQ